MGMAQRDNTKTPVAAAALIPAAGSLPPPPPRLALATGSEGLDRRHSAPSSGAGLQGCLASFSIRPGLADFAGFSQPGRPMRAGRVPAWFSSPPAKLVRPCALLVPLLERSGRPKAPMARETPPPAARSAQAKAGGSVRIPPPPPLPHPAASPSSGSLSGQEWPPLGNP